MILISYIFLFLLFSRGLLEILFDKNLAYIAQLISMVLILFILSPKKKINFFTSLDIILIFSYIFISLISAFFTAINNNFQSAFIYTLANIYIVSYIYQNTFASHIYITRYKIIYSLEIVAIILLFSSVLQQANFITLPGDNYFNVLRPSSLTGSYLHYPIIIAVLSVIFMEIFIKNKKKHFLIVSIVLLLGVIYSYSRSGVMIIIISYLYYLLKLNKYYFSLILIMVILIICGEYSDVYISRISSIFSINSPGNIERITIWKDSLRLIFDGYFLIGSHTGMYTNITKNLTNIDSIVLESTALQQIVNFGFLGFGIFYFFLFMVYKRINNQCMLMKGLALSCIIQSLIYQSGEVIPFIYLYSLLPGISNSKLLFKSQSK